MIEELVEIQNRKGASDQEFAHLLGLKSRQAWFYIKLRKRGLTLSVLCAALRAFPEIVPEMLIWMRDFRGNGKR